MKLTTRILKRLNLYIVDSNRTQNLVYDKYSDFYWGSSYKMKRFLYAVNHPIRYIQLMQLRKVEIKETTRYMSIKPYLTTKSIFIRIPKSAGRSISQSLYCCLGGSHLKTADYMAALTKVEFEQAYKFAFVRNPWDRLASAYFFLIEGGVSSKDAKWGEYFKENFSDFEDFVKNWLNEENINKEIHFIPQYKFVADSENNILVDFLGYFERINDDFESIKRKLNIDINLKKVNITKKRQGSDYRNLYTEETKNIVHKVYKRDIELFGYDFDNAKFN